jgi:hypothetical protein
MRNTKHAGELAELLFEYRATAMGMTVCRPHGDNARYDFAVDNGTRFWKAQVKSCGAPPRGRHYNLNVCRHSQLGAKHYLPSEINILAAYVVPENRWYLFPVAVLDGRLNLKVEINEQEGGRFWNYVEAWDHLRTTDPAPILAPPLNTSDNPPGSAPQTALPLSFHTPLDPSPNPLMNEISKRRIDVADNHESGRHRRLARQQVDH